MGKKKSKPQATGRRCPSYPTLSTNPRERRRQVWRRNRQIQTGVTPTDAELDDMEQQWQMTLAAAKLGGESQANRSAWLG
jgi:hypothetical protein